MQFKNKDKEKLFFKPANYTLLKPCITPIPQAEPSFPFKIQTSDKPQNESTELSTIPEFPILLIKIKTLMGNQRYCSGTEQSQGSEALGNSYV